MTEQNLSVEGVTKEFAGDEVLKGVTFSLERGESGVIVGPSGAGKTTLLGIVAGTIPANSGRVSIGGVVVEDQRKGIHLRPAERNLGYVFQNYLLFPHMSVSQNVAYGLSARKLPELEIRSRVARMLNLLDIADLARKMPAQLSGGQMQRVALARALILEPQVVLLDEPLSALDRPKRESMRLELAKLFRKLESTVLFVTHDLDEAFFFGQRVGLLDQGRLQFFGKKSELLSTLSAQTATFLGYNLLRVSVVEQNGGQLTVMDAGNHLMRVRVGPNTVRPGANALIAVAPDSVKVFAQSPSFETRHPSSMRAEVLALWDLRDRVRVELQGSPDRIIAEVHRAELTGGWPRVGQEVDIEFENAVLVNEP